jgi:hypothetical protein
VAGSIRTTISPRKISITTLLAAIAVVSTIPLFWSPRLIATIAVDSEHCQFQISSWRCLTDIQIAPHIPLSPPLDVIIPLPSPDLDINAAVDDALHTHYLVALACELATLTGVSLPLLDGIQNMVVLAWSKVALDPAELQQRMQVIFEDIQNSILPIPFDLHGTDDNDLDDLSLFEINRTACFLLLDGIRAGLRSLSPEIAGLVKAVQAQVNAIAFLHNILPERYVFAACIAKSFAADTDMSHANSLIASVNDQSVKTLAYHLLTIAHSRDSAW